MIYSIYDERYVRDSDAFLELNDYRAGLTVSAIGKLGIMFDSKNMVTNDIRTYNRIVSAGKKNTFDMFTDKISDPITGEEHEVVLLIWPGEYNRVDNPDVRGRAVLRTDAEYLLKAKSDFGKSVWSNMNHTDLNDLNIGPRLPKVQIDQPVFG